MEIKGKVHYVGSESLSYTGNPNIRRKWLTTDFPVPIPPVIPTDFIIFFPLKYILCCQALLANA